MTASNNTFYKPELSTPHDKVTVYAAIYDSLDTGTLSTYIRSWNILNTSSPSPRHYFTSPDELFTKFTDAKNCYIIEITRPPQLNNQTNIVLSLSHKPQEIKGLITKAGQQFDNTFYQQQTDNTNSPSL